MSRSKIVIWIKKTSLQFFIQLIIIKEYNMTVDIKKGWKYFISITIVLALLKIFNVIVIDWVIVFIPVFIPLALMLIGIIFGIIILVLMFILYWFLMVFK